MKQRSYRVAIVILNYLNYLDTIECVESINKNGYDLCGIIIVDNGSENDSYNKLKQELGGQQNVHILKAKKNYGYARGNNIGIRYATKRMNADFVLVANNDTIFLEKDYVEKLLSVYKKGIGVIGSEIILKNGVKQNVMEEHLGLKDTFFSFINAWSYDRGASFDFPTMSGKSEKVLHGCAILFTPSFFEYYRGFYKRTFLYKEEAILKLMCKCKKLRQVYVPDAKIFHKEDQSSEMSFDNDIRIMTKYSNKSQKYVFWWSLKYFVKVIVIRHTV